MIDCPSCHRSGKCARCGGQGLADGKVCDQCKGSRKCPKCNGAGRHDYYAILQLQRDAKPEEVEHNYHELYHPSSLAGDEEYIRRLKTAYETLRDPAQRQAYDSELAKTSHTAPSDESQASGTLIFVDLDVNGLMDVRCPNCYQTFERKKTGAVETPIICPTCKKAFVITGEEFRRMIVEAERGRERGEISKWKKKELVRQVRENSRKYYNERTPIYLIPELLKRGVSAEAIIKVDPWLADQVNCWRRDYPPKPRGEAQGQPASVSSKHEPAKSIAGKETQSLQQKSEQPEQENISANKEQTHPIAVPERQSQQQSDQHLRRSEEEDKRDERIGRWLLCGVPGSVLSAIVFVIAGRDLQRAVIGGLFLAIIVSAIISTVVLSKQGLLSIAAVTSKEASGEWARKWTRLFVFFGLCAAIAFPVLCAVAAALLGFTVRVVALTLVGGIGGYFIPPVTDALAQIIKWDQSHPNGGNSG